MNRPLMIILFVMAMMFGAALMMNDKAQAHDGGGGLLDQTEPSLRIQPDKSVPRLSMA